MNTDASANVDVRGDASAELPLLPWLAGGFLALGGPRGSSLPGSSCAPSAAQPNRPSQSPTGRGSRRLIWIMSLGSVPPVGDTGVLRHRIWPR